MPVVVTARIHVKEELRKDFLRDVVNLVKESRNELGCVSYSCAEDIASPGAYLFTEEWMSRSAVDAHFETEHFRRFAARLPERCKEKPSIRIYTADSVDTL